MAKKNTCLRALITATMWLPVLVTGSIFGWGWFAYTFQLTIFSVDSLVQQIIFLTLFHILYIFSLWSYIQTISKAVTKIPSKFFLSPEMIEELDKTPSDQQREEILAYVVKKNDLPVSCRTYGGGIRFCEKCNLIKPDRCHHCSICGVCILRMDHHCPWINNCVTFTNHKFFVLFLGYTLALCIFVAATTFPYFLKFWYVPEMTKQPLTNNSNEILSEQQPGSLQPVSFSVKFNVLFLFFVSSMLSVGVMFLHCYHIHLLINNRSTLESFRPPLMVYGPDRNAFNLGIKENVNRLFGRAKLLWLVPIFTTEGSGFVYDQRRQLNQIDEESKQGLLNTPKLENESTQV